MNFVDKLINILMFATIITCLIVIIAMITTTLRLFWILGTKILEFAC